MNKDWALFKNFIISLNLFLMLNLRFSFSILLVITYNCQWMHWSHNTQKYYITDPGSSLVFFLLQLTTANECIAVQIIKSITSLILMIDGWNIAIVAMKFYYSDHASFEIASDRECFWKKGCSSCSFVQKFAWVFSWGLWIIF